MIVAANRSGIAVGQIHHARAVEPAVLDISICKDHDLPGDNNEFHPSQVQAT